MGRFDRVEFDNDSKAHQVNLKSLCKALELEIGKYGPNEASGKALDKLNEVYMWAAKAIEDDQLIKRVAE